MLVGWLNPMIADGEDEVCAIYPSARTPSRSSGFRVNLYLRGEGFVLEASLSLISCLLLIGWMMMMMMMMN
jgi:hypothetical protein